MVPLDYYRIGSIYFVRCRMAGHMFKAEGGRYALGGFVCGLWGVVRDSGRRPLA